MTPPGESPLLEIDNLVVHFTTRHGVVQGVRGVHLVVRSGETLGIVGESGSGKSVTVQAVMGLINVPGEIVSGEIRWKGRSLLGPAGKAHLEAVRGKEISMIFQDPMTSLDPLFNIGTQLTEVLRHHLGLRKRQARDRAVELPRKHVQKSGWTDRLRLHGTNHGHADPSRVVRQLHRGGQGAGD